MAARGVTIRPLQDRAWRTAFRLGFPVARLWWRLLGARHQGAIVAVHVGRSLLLLKSSYRTAWNFPGGGVRPGEAPEAAARRELAEEIGLVTDAKLLPAGVISGLWDGRLDTVHLFAVHLDRLPKLHLDNREIVGAELVAAEDLPRFRLTGPAEAYLQTTDIV